MKTKKVSGVDLPASSFAYVGDESDTATWVLPIHVPGDRQKTVNLIKSAAYRVADTRAIPESERQKVFLKIAGAAQAHGIRVEQPASAMAHPKTEQPLDAEDVEEKAARAEAELHRERLIKQIGNWWDR